RGKASRRIVEGHRTIRVSSTSSLDVVSGRLLISNLGIEPTDARPAPERDRPTEGCQLAVLTCARTVARRGRSVKDESRPRLTNRRRQARSEEHTSELQSRV